MDKKDITIKALDLGIKIDGVRLLKGLSFDCCQGQWTLLCGPSGSGKSTLLRALNGLCAVSEGSVVTLGSKLPGRSRRDATKIWRQCGTVLQEIALFETRTSSQNVELALKAVGESKQDAKKKAHQWLERLGLYDKVDQYPCNLSGGQRQRVALARAFAINPKILFLDEPTSALDQESSSEVMGFIAELVEQGTSVVMSTHRIAEASGYCSQMIDLCNGEIVEIKDMHNQCCGDVIDEIPARCLEIA